MEIIWSRSAKETLATVLDYIEEYFDSTVAMKVYNKINNHVDLLVSFPRMGVRDPRFSIDEMEVHIWLILLILFIMRLFKMLL